MTDAEIISRVWQRAPAWDFNRSEFLRLPGPIERLGDHIPAGYDSSFATIPIVEFQRERAVKDGLEFWRIIGRLRDTEICVEQQPCDFA